MLNVQFVGWNLSASLDLWSGAWQASIASMFVTTLSLDTEAVFWEPFKLSLNLVPGHSLTKFSTYGVCFLEHKRIFYMTFHFAGE